MKIVEGWPPNIDYLAEHFPKIREGRAYICYGDTLYNPTGLPISDACVAHEEAHSVRQLAYKGGPDAFVERYIKDPSFRRDEEAIGYAAELRYLVSRTPGGKWRFIETLAARMASPLYNLSCTSREARTLILTAL